MKDIENTKKEAPIKEAPMLGLTGLGGGVASLMWHHAAAGLVKGKLWAWGNNSYGTLMANLNGGGPGKRSSPVQIGTDSNWTYLLDAGNAGNYVTFAGKDDGTLWTAGYGNLSGLNQPGFPPTAVLRSSPTQLPGTWSGAMARNGESVIATKADGTLWTWGSNQHGILGLNQAYGPGDKKNRSSPCQVGTDTDWTISPFQVSMGQEFAFAMKQNGTLWVWGKNDNNGFANGQPGNYRRSSPTQIPGTTWAEIHAGGGGSLNLTKKTDGSLWVWGNDGAGSLGLNGSGPKNSPTQIGTDTNWAGITVGGSAAFCTKTDGSLWSWGNGYNGKLGHNQKNTDYSSPKQVGYDTNWNISNHGVASINVAMAAIKQDGTMWTWGTNEVGQLGLNGNLPTSYSSPVQMGTSTDWLAVAGISAADKNFLALRK